MRQPAHRTKKDFANDVSAYDRLKRSVEVLARGQGTQYKRLEVVKAILEPLRVKDFPQDLQKDFKVVERMLDRANDKRKPTFKDFSRALVKLYGEICAARGKYAN